jgi:hypothetical protein
MDAIVPRIICGRADILHLALTESFNLNAQFST